MIDPDNVPAVASDEVLARYVLHSGHIRRSDNSIKPDAFIPFPHGDLSVTRHLSTTEAQLWDVGRSVAAATIKTLYGRADIVVASCLAQKLDVIAVPIVSNTNHANVTRWPADKPLQKIIPSSLLPRLDLLKLPSMFGSRLP